MSGTFTFGALWLSALLRTEPSVESLGPIAPERVEWGVLPALNYDTDIGLGFGLIGTLVGFDREANPYAGRVLLHLFAAAKPNASGQLELPFHSHYLHFDVPHFLTRSLRVTGELAFRRFTNSGYYGLGQGSTRSTPSEEILDADQPGRYHRYERTFPSFRTNARWALYDAQVALGKRRLEWFSGFTISHSATRLYSGSLLQADLQARGDAGPDGAALRELLRGDADHVLLQLQTGLTWDTRDHEFTPSRGTFSEISLRVSPGVAEELRFAGLYLGTSWFAALAGHWLTAGVRLGADLLAGNVPFYELARMGGLEPIDGPGGGYSLRGVLLQRYHGKLKVVANFELRSMWSWFSLFGGRQRLGLVAFADTGRVWGDWSAVSVGGRELDQLGFALGWGGGLRLQWGETFIIRADLAHSPTDDTTGFYIDVGQVF